MKSPLTHIHNKTDKPQADLDIPIFPRWDSHLGIHLSSGVWQGDHVIAMSNGHGHGSITDVI